MEKFSAILGFVVILGLTWLLSKNRRAINWKTVGWGLGLQIVIAIAVLKGQPISEALSFLAPSAGRGSGVIVFLVVLAVTIALVRKVPDNAGRLWGGFGVITAIIFLRFNLLAYFFDTMRTVVTKLIGFTVEGAKFVFGNLAESGGSIGFIFAFQVLPTIIFIASIFAILYYLGVMQIVVRFFAKIMTRFMGASGAESMNTAASIFMGQTEAPLTIRPFLSELTESELMTVMVGGMATVSGGILAAYVLVAGVDVVHLLTASIMAAPAAIMLAKMMVPETEKPKTGSDVNFEVPKVDVNLIDAAGRGAIEGLQLSLNVAGMLIAFIALIALVNGLFLYVHDGLIQVGGQVIDPIGPILVTVGNWFPSSFDQLLGWIFMPIAWAMGVPWAEASTVGNLLGTRMVLNEFVAFVRLGEIKDVLSERSFVISTYALCGFANFSSIAIQIGGIGALAPTRRHDLARLGLRAMLAGTFANFLSATIAGILL
jgi:CNT family concentrative nucleoside transporter